MSRYVTKPHGIVIGSGNVFFFCDEKDEYHDYPACVSLKSYYFENYSTLHVGVRSPAEQMVFKPVEFEESKTFGDKTWVDKTTKYRLKSWWVKWLDDNCPGWGYPPPSNADRNPTIFFRTRKDALAFTNRVLDSLKGLEFM